MLILAGVAAPGWDTDSDDVDRKTLVVKLGVTTTPHFQATASVALAAISNTDSDFVFAADDSRIRSDPQGQLELEVDLALMGDESGLLRLSYHVQVLSDPLPSFVSGSIRWSDQLGAPTLAAQAGDQPLFRVAAGRFVQDVGGGFSLGKNHWIERAQTWSSVPRHVDGMWAAGYILRGISFHERLQILPALQTGVLDRPMAGYQAAFQPSREIELSPSVPALTDVDFEMSLSGGLG
jgi:hypothetical protein